MAGHILHHCAHCGAEFQRSRPDANRQNYCSVACRFWAKVDKSAGPGGCWPWVAKARTSNGVNALSYGSFAVSTRKRDRSNRVAWELTNGPIPDSLCVCHKCDNPLCCNPGHFFLGTRLDNVIDMYRKGREPVMSAEGKARLIASKLGKKRSPETVELMRQSMLGRKQSDESNRKRSASLRATWALRKAKLAGGASP